MTQDIRQALPRDTWEPIGSDLGHEISLQILGAKIAGPNEQPLYAAFILSGVPFETRRGNSRGFSRRRSASPQCLFFSRSRLKERLEHLMLVIFRNSGDRDDCVYGVTRLGHVPGQGRMDNLLKVHGYEVSAASLRHAAQTASGRPIAATDDAGTAAEQHTATWVVGGSDSVRGVGGAEV
jgi:hypothetical protein